MVHQRCQPMVRQQHTIFFQRHLACPDTAKSIVRNTSISVHPLSMRKQERRVGDNAQAQILQQAMWAWASMPANTHTHTPCWVGRPPASSALGSYSPSNLSFLHWSLARSWLGDESLCHHNYRTCTPQPAHACLVWNTTAVVVACTHAHPQQQWAIRWPRMIAAAAVSMWGIQTLPTVLKVAWFLCKNNPLVTIRRL